MVLDVVVVVVVDKMVEKGRGRCYGTLKHEESESFFVILSTGALAAFKVQI